MRIVRSSLAGAATLVLVGSLTASVAARSGSEAADGPDFAWAASVTESSCEEDGSRTAEGEGDGYTWWRGYTYTCDIETSDPRVSGTLTGVFNDDCFGDPDVTCVFWNTETIAGPDGTWTGWVWGTHHPTNPESTMAAPVASSLKVFTGHGSYEGLTFLMHGQGFLGDKEFHGLIYEGSPPPPLDELRFPMPADS